MGDTEDLRERVLFDRLASIPPGYKPDERREEAFAQGVDAVLAEVTTLRTQFDEAVRLLRQTRLGLVAIHVGAEAGIATPSASLALSVESIARSAIRSIDDFLSAAALNKEPSP